MPQPFDRSNFVPANVGVHIYPDQEAGVIRAYLSDPDLREKAEICTMPLNVAAKFPGAYAAWVRGVSAMGCQIVADLTGVPTTHDAPIVLNDPD